MQVNFVFIRSTEQFFDCMELSPFFIYYSNTVENLVLTFFLLETKISHQLARRYKTNRRKKISKIRLF